MKQSIIHVALVVGDNEMLSAGINFVREPKEAPYGTAAVFEDLYGNLWDLLGPVKRVTD